MTGPNMPRAGTCRECGLIHPPVAKGCCPIARGKKLKDDIKLSMDEKLIDYNLKIRESFVAKTKDISEEKLENLFKQIMKMIEES